jgi:hypothetical protein
MNTIRQKYLILVIMGLILGLFSCGKEGKKEVEFKPLPDSGFRAELRVKEIPLEIKKGGQVNTIVTVKNISDQTWPSKGDSKDHYRVNLSYRFFNEAGEPLAIEGERSNLLMDLKPGESVNLTAVVKAPEKPGKYEIRFDMVQEAVAWFGHKNKDNYSNPFNIAVKP